jgi:[ribosomal protein S18]-alanine N-acetyltransferase
MSTSETSVSLRPMVEDDLKAVGIIESQSYPTPWTQAHFTDEMNKPFARCYVLTDDATDSIVIGYIVYWLQAEGVSLLNVAIDPKWRGFGFGMKLMQAMIKDAVKEEISRVVLEVRESNKNAIALYESIGFKVTHVRENFYADGETAWVMEIKTSEASSLIQ